MFIIVEGPDGAGKSTLVDQLIRQFPFATRLHFGAPTDDKPRYQVYHKEILRASRISMVTIMDRSWYSDLVYAPIMRGQTELTIAEAHDLDRTVRMAGGGLIVYCTADIDLLWSRCQSRGETYIPDKDTLERISIGYQTLMLTPLLPVIKHNTNTLGRSI